LEIQAPSRGRGKKEFWGYFKKESTFCSCDNSPTFFSPTFSKRLILTRLSLKWKKNMSRLCWLTKWSLTRSARNWLVTIRLPYAGPTTSLKSAKGQLYERRPLADFRLAVGPAYGSRMVAKRFCADRVMPEKIRVESGAK
jgi:hypothetical protein